MYLNYPSSASIKCEYCILIVLFPWKKAEFAHTNPFIDIYYVSLCLLFNAWFGKQTEKVKKENWQYKPW